jgi:hypothetical protein
VVCFADLVRTITVLNVGDGACSVVRERFGEDGPRNHTAIIDCGGNSAVEAALILADHLSSADWRSLSELVVTHFDADHWRGLWLIAQRAPSGSAAYPSLLPIYFPAVPFNADRRLPGSLTAFITATGPFGVQAMDLQAAWRRLTRIKLVPLAKGAPFTLAGRLHEVVWPPQFLDERSAQRLNKLVQRIQAEADRLADEGYPRLKRSLRKTYQNGSHNQHPGQHPGEVIMADVDFGQPGPGAGEGEEEPRDSRTGDVPVPAIPREWARRDDFRKLVKAARRAQNDLSLVFHDPERASLLVFGDAPRRIVERLSGELGARRYQVALAPHHGSHKVPGNTPAAETCVSQQGRHRGRDWPNHRDSHDSNGNCVHTRDHEVYVVLR